MDSCGSDDLSSVGGFALAPERSFSASSLMDYVYGTYTQGHRARP